jgi:ketosteroid isomerase-like protein
MPVPAVIVLGFVAPITCNKPTKEKCHMPNDDRIQLTKDLYEAYTSGDRKFYEDHLSDDFTFSSPADVGLDKAGYFERCWPGAGQGGKFDYVRLIESGSEVVVTYESTAADGSRGRNTEIVGFSGNNISSIEVYFGWNIAT